MRLVSPPTFLKKIYSSLIWNIPVAEKKIFLTFDDGPIPEATSFVLETLRQYNAKATFFCIGNNIEKHPEIFKKIIHDGHAVGNHTWSHVNGWKTKTQSYVAEVNRCAKQLHSNLFRPPYGKISRNQIKALAPTYHIIMWDVLSYDYDYEVTPQQCLANVIRHVRPGSIIVFHDSIKAFKNMSYALPLLLQELVNSGYTFDVIPQRPTQ
jgi:peptidoglycan-N-acetylglucosamine deacetylase